MPWIIRQLQASVGTVKASNVGVGAEVGTIDLFVYGDLGPTNSMHERTGVGLTPLRTEKVPVVILDDYAADISMIDFVNIDVEGNELAVPKGSRPLLTERRIGALQFEYSGCFIDFRTLLRDNFDLLQPDYHIVKILSHRLQPVEQWDQKLENFQYANFVAVRR